MPEEGSIRKQRDGSIVLDEREVNFEDLLTVAYQEFPGVPLDRIYFKQPSYLDGYNDLLLAEHKPHPFQVLADGLQASMPACITMAQVVRQIGEHDRKKTKILWSKHGFHISIQ